MGDLDLVVFKVICGFILLTIAIAESTIFEVLLILLAFF